MSKQTKSRSTNTSKIPDELNSELRLKQLESLGKSLEIDNTESIASYYKGSPEMIKTADAQYSDNQLENAFISYLKFLDLFHNKITHHVDYKHVPLSIKSTNQYYQRHAQNRVKELRQKLLKNYKDIAYAHKKPEEVMTMKKYRKQDTVVSKINFLKSQSVLHTSTNAIDRTILDIEACRSLRTVVVPKQLPTIFQIINQKKVDYMWADLAGELVNNEYVVTHLIIPKKKDVDLIGSYYDPASCDRYIQKNRLTVLGWIHLHKFSTCYMSSMDLHAQWMYQSKFPEAIAIVCAPRRTQVETYMLLKHGLDYVGGCTKKGMHTHQSSKPLYTIARHVKVVYHMQFEVVYLKDGNCVAARRHEFDCTN